MRIPRLNEHQYAIMTVGIIVFGLIYLILFYEEEPLRCSALQSREEAIERGCPILKEEARALIMRA